MDGKGHIIFTLIFTQLTAITKRRLFFFKCVLFTEFPFLHNSAARTVEWIPIQGEIWGVIHGADRAGKGKFKRAKV